MDKIQSIDGGGIPNKSREQLRALKEDLETTTEVIVIMAQLTRVKYDALLEQKFTAEQALELCKTLM